MTAQSLAREILFDHNRSWQFHWDQGYDFRTSLPGRTVMFGGSLRQALTTEIGTVDDSVVDVCTAVHLSGVLSAIGVGTKVQKIRTGIMRFSGDVLPWIGEGPPDILGRQQATGKEGVATGYTGDGMSVLWGGGCSKDIGGIRGGGGY
ncbi:hypothetical protein B9Z19DRAFT_1134104 [Tuber borchii]|uniref:Uncharacterized protein n=1 Tax=Tuber borchii TaxID=42251 RepID=A0A2T6ZEQ5_TUBBO|nr:hypothetical protein B9Z19DRAFT_1134104 [Tuber borchii]